MSIVVNIYYSGENGSARRLLWEERSNNDTTERYRTSAETETVAVFLQSGYLE